MYCPKCGKDNQAGAGSCEKCGTSFGGVTSAPAPAASTAAAGRECPKCGKLNTAAARECDKCGTALTGTVPPPTRPPAAGRPQAPPRPRPQAAAVKETTDAAGVPVACPACRTPSDSIKQYRFPELFVFLLVLYWVRTLTYTACPSCMRKKLALCAVINVVTANIVWPFVLFPWYSALALASFTRGHSKAVLAVLRRSG